MKNNNKEILEIIEKAQKKSNISIRQSENLLNKPNESIDYKDELNKIIIPDSSKKIIFTDGNSQLMYDNGEFFKISTTDATKQKVKLTRKEATDCYIEYYINSILNPLVKNRNENQKINYNIKSKKKDYEYER